MPIPEYQNAWLRGNIIGTSKICKNKKNNKEVKKKWGTSSI